MNIYLAPMEGVTNYIIRNAFHHHFNQIDKYFTPFIPAAQRMNYKYIRDIKPENNEGIEIVPQLIANKSEDILFMIEQLKAYGYKEFNINLGCPSGTVTGKGRGSGMLKDTYYLEKYLDEIYSKTDVPVSIKTRIGFTELNEWPEILRVYSHFPMHEFIIHPRLRKEFYSGFPHTLEFKKAYDLFSIDKLCYNGDIWDMECYDQLIALCPNLKIIMIGRGLIARPDLCCQIKGIDVPDLRNKLINFCNEIYDGYNAIYTGEKDVVRHMKEIWANLGKSFKNSEKLVKKIMKLSTPDEYRSVTRQIFETLELSDR